MSMQCHFLDKMTQSAHEQQTSMHVSTHLTSNYVGTVITVYTVWCSSTTYKSPVRV